MKLIPSKYSFRLVRANAVLSSKKSGSVGSSSAKMISEGKSISDQRRRLFLKALGVIGLGAVGATMFPRRAKALAFGGAPVANKVRLMDSNNNQINPATDATLATVKTNFDNLKTKTSDIITNTANIITNVANIPALSHYGSMASSTPVTIADDQTTVPVHGYGIFTPATLTATDDDSLWYLRKITKQLESLNTIDSTGKRKRVVVDSSTDMDLATATTGGVQTSTAGYGMQMYQDIARNEFANSIRKKLIFS